MAIAKDKYVKYDEERAEWIKSVLNEFVKGTRQTVITPINQIVEREKAKIDEKLKERTNLKSEQVEELEQYKEDLDYAFGNLSCQAQFGYYRAATSEYSLVQVDGEDYIKEDYYLAFVEMDERNKRGDYYVNLDDKIELLTLMHGCTEEADWKLDLNYE